MDHPAAHETGAKCLAVGEKIAYGLGDFATGFSGITVGTFVMYFYTDVIGISATLLGAALLVARLLDAVSNVAMGYIVDKTHSRYGKARAWILWSTVPFGISLLCVFSPPEGLGKEGLLVFAIVALSIHFLVYTASNIPYGTLAALITRDSMQRSSLNGYRMVFYFASMLLLPSITLPLVDMLGGGRSGWRWVILGYVSLMIIAFLYTFMFTHERVKAVKPTNGQLPFTVVAKSLLANRYWLVMFVVMLLSFSILGLVNGVGVYYAKYVIGDSYYVGILNILFALPLMLVLLCASWVMARIGRMAFVMSGMVGLILGSLIMAWGPDDLLWVYTGTLLRGAGFAPIMGNAYAMLANTIDYGEWKDGIRNDGLAYSGGSFSAILGSGIASGGIGWVLGVAGYIPGSVYDAGSTIHQVIVMLFIHIPVVLALLTLLALRFYRLEAIYPRIVHDLEIRAQQQAMRE